jgi:GAF domain-containing protein
VDRIFKDSELIRSLGCGSIINAPIVDGGTTVAALNILDAAGTYTDDDVATAVEIAGRSKNMILEAMKEK